MSLPQLLYITDVVNRPEYIPRNPTAENLPNVFDIRFPKVYIHQTQPRNLYCNWPHPGAAISTSDHNWKFGGNSCWENAETDQKHILWLPAIAPIPRTTFSSYHLQHTTFSSYHLWHYILQLPSLAHHILQLHHIHQLPSLALHLYAISSTPHSPAIYHL